MACPQDYNPNRAVARPSRPRYAPFLRVALPHPICQPSGGDVEQTPRSLWHPFLGVIGQGLHGGQAGGDSGDRHPRTAMSLGRTGGGLGWSTTPSSRTSTLASGYTDMARASTP